VPQTFILIGVQSPVAFDLHAHAMSAGQTQTQTASRSGCGKSVATFSHSYLDQPLRHSGIGLIKGFVFWFLKKKMYFNLFLNWTDLQSKDLFIFKSKVQVYLFYSCFPDQVMLKYLQILRKAKYLMLPDTIFIPL